MKILITGGLGNLGSWLSEYLAQQGHAVSTFGPSDREVLRNINITRYFGDIRKEDEVNVLFDRDRWDIVIHLASINEGGKPGYAKAALEINSWGTRNLLQSCLRQDKPPHVIYFSTFHVYGVSAGKVSEEGTPAVPRNDYGITHLFAEYYVRQFGLCKGVPYTIFRLTNSYGCPKETGSSKWYLVLNDLAKSAYEKKIIRLSSNGLPQRDLIWMGDVCRVVDAVIRKGPSDTIYNLGSGSSRRMIDVARVVQNAYTDFFSAPISLEVNQDDKSLHDTMLDVSIEKLSNYISFSPEDKMYEEAIAIFNLLSHPSKL